MNTTGADHESVIAQLTKTAGEAARSGQWDIVIQCYRDRGILLETTRGTIDQGEDLLKVDCQVRDHVRTILALLASLLGETAATKRRLQGLRQRLGVPTLASEAMSIEA